MKKLEGKVALVTGGGTGIGKGVVEMLAENGAKLIIGGIDFIDSDNSQYKSKNIGGLTAAKKLADKLNSKGVEAIAYEADVVNKTQVERMIDHAVKNFGRIDILVHCAGVITSNFVSDLSEEEWDNVITVNTKGTFLVNQAVAKQMKKQGEGKIINIASIAGNKGFAGLAHYCASKHAVIGFTKSLANELIKDNITVNAVCPGIVGTQMWTMLADSFADSGESNKESYKRNVEAMIPQGVPQSVEDMAEAVLFLINSDHVTAQAISVDGGAGQ